MQYISLNNTIRWQMPKSTHISNTLKRKLLPFHRYTNFDFFYFQEVVQGHNFLNYIIWWHMSKSTNVSPHIFALALTVSEIKKFRIFELQKVDQGHEMQC